MQKLKKKSKLDARIDELLDEMESEFGASEDYAKMASNVEVLMHAKSFEKKNVISADTLAVVGGNLLGILIVLYFEKVDIITSKAFGMILKRRV